MLTDFNPTPQQAGHAIGLAIAGMPFLFSVLGPEEPLLTDAAITRERLSGERLLLCVSAAEFVIDQTVQDSRIGQEVKSGLHACLKQSFTGELSAFVLSNLTEAVSYFTEAALEDPSRGPSDRGEKSEIELAFADRLFELGHENETRARACYLLSSTTPCVSWNSVAESAVRMLASAALITVQ